MFLVDAILINLSFILAYFVRFEILLFITPQSIPIFEHYFKVLIFITLLWLALFKLFGLYEQKKFTLLLDELAALFLSVTFSTLALLGLLFLYREFWFSRLVVVNVWWIALLLLGLARIIAFEGGRLFKRRGLGVKNVLILGQGEIGEALRQKMLADPGLGYRPIAIIPGAIGLDELKRIILDKKISEIIIAGSDLSAERTLDIITECERFGIEFKIVPGILELISSRLDIDELGGIPLFTVSEIRLKGLNAWLKRGLDIGLSLLGIIILSPLFLVFTVLIKLTSPGPVLFVQERIGLDGKPFPIFKFRSMVEGAEALLPQLTAKSEASGHLFKIKADPRITPLGRFMRRWSIDELPQIFDVFLGYMSLVGPRPPLPNEVAKYTPWQLKRLRSRPGITGPWQVAGRSLLPFDDMVRLDLYYIENWSLWLDLKILLRTLPVVLFGTGAY